MQPCEPRVSLGAPAYHTAAQSATLLWEDPDTGRWHLRVTGGDSASVLRFRGAISGAQVNAVNDYNCESKDQIDQNAQTLSYELNVVGRGEDGFGFTVEPGTSPCLDISGSDSTRLLLGKSMKPVDGPLNLATLQACKP
jgi:hypothetical protein